MINVKNTWFDILDDILAGNISMSMFSKKNRLFYIGLTIIIIAMVLYIYNYFSDDEDSDEII